MIEIKVDAERTSAKGGNFNDAEEMLLELLHAHKALYEIVKVSVKKIGDGQERAMIGAFIAFLIEYNLVGKMNKELQRYVNGEMRK